MPITVIFFGLLLLPILLFGQDSTKSGNYTYRSLNFKEGIELFENGTFRYIRNSEFLRISLNGNWQIRNDTLLVLDSKPQRTKFMVWESNESGKKILLRIRDMQNSLIHYHLYLITNKGDTVVVKNQFGETATKEKFSSFYLVDSKGLHSPLYVVKGAKTNFFEIHFETCRVFENEIWILKEQSIVPVGIDNKYSNYQLFK